MRRLVSILFVVLALGAARAEAVSVRDIIELSKGGLSDEILLALIEIDRRVYPVDPATLKQLKDAGVSERVILAMVRSGRTPVEPPVPAPPPVPAAAPPPAPQVVVIDHHEHYEPAPRVREVAVPVPIYVPVVVPRRGSHVPGATPIVPFSSIGLPHPRMGLSAPPPTPTSDPPYWKQQQQRHP